MLRFPGKKVAFAALLLTAAGPLLADAAPFQAPAGITVPATAKPFLNDPNDFQFAIVGDRTGGHREGVFEQAVRELNLLQPEFVITIGDQIEGYADDPAEIKRQWTEFEGLVNQLHMRYFYVVGNHDMSNDTMRSEWLKQRGNDYYHFVYKNVLFIALNSEDPPNSEKKKELFKSAGPEKTQLLMQLMQQKNNPDEAKKLIAQHPELMQMIEQFKNADRATISDRQVAYVKQALADNTDVRWTVLLMHKPVWRYKDVPQFGQIETLLAKRPYTMFAGHMHEYAYTKRNDRDYVQLGTTGGIAENGPAQDHIMWVTMTRDGPQIANIRLNGLFDKHGSQP